MIRVLGVDPGLANTGYGIIDSDGVRVKHVTHGHIVTDKKDPPAKRLEQIYSSLVNIIEEFKPNAAGIEELFFAKNVKSALPVAETKGVALLLFQQKNLIIGQYTPLQIKQSLVGNGRAEKHQVQEMLKLILKLPSIPKPDHAADALAAAVCHVHLYNFQSRHTALGL